MSPLKIASFLAVSVLPLALSTALAAPVSSALTNGGAAPPRAQQKPSPVSGKGLAGLKTAQAPVQPVPHSFTHGVQVDYDVAYGIGICLDKSGKPYKRELKLDVYRPVASPSKSKLAVILIHGGVWGVAGVDKQYYPMVRAGHYLAGRGAVCFSIDFRTDDLDPDAYGVNHWVKAQRASYVDAKAAVRWIRAHADAYGIRPDRIAAFGGSSGAQSAMILAITEPEDFSTDYPGGVIPPENHPGEDPSVQACLEFWGTCLEKIWGNPPELRLFGFEDEFDPFDPPVMITHGTEDKLIPYTDGLAIQWICQQNGIPHKFYSLAGVEHGEWSVNHGSPPRTLYELAGDFLEFDLGWDF